MRLVLSIAVALTLSSAASAQEPVKRGRALLGEFCSRCHAVARWGKSPNKAAPPFRFLGRSYDLDQFPRMLERGISSGHPDMPEFKFSVEDAKAVQAYLRSIQQ